MQVGLKIWRYDSKTGDRALKEYEVDAPELSTKDVRFTKWEPMERKY